VEVPKQRNSRQENARIKAGQIPVEWDEDKSCHKDTDARWVKKNGVSFFGYKDHVKTDSGTNLISDYVATSANVHDSTPFAEMVGEADRGTNLHADSAYKGAESDELLESFGIDNQVHEKGNRGAALTETQRRHNRQKSKIRALVEHVFGFMENSMNGIYLRTIGMKRAKCVIGLANLVYNFCRYTQLVRLGRVQAA
jgi:IS5 family transposase